MLEHRPQSQSESPLAPGANYINAAYGARSWLLTTDHKRIALLYLVAPSSEFVTGTIIKADDGQGSR